LTNQRYFGTIDNREENMATKNPFAVKHNLDQLSKEELVQYLRDVSEFIGLDPDLNGLDTIYMNNETGPGRSLVVYARRGTAEILRNKLGIEVDSLTHESVNGSIVFTAKGHTDNDGHGKRGRHEIAIGSKFLGNLSGKELDDAIMTASTRALRRLTMQFTTLGILDESEVVSLLGHAPNPAGSAQLAANPLPPMYAVPTVPANNAPGKSVERDATTNANETHPEPLGEPFVGQQDQIDAAMAQVATKQAARQADKEAEMKADTKAAPVTSTPVESVTSTDKQTDIEAAEISAPKRARKSRKSVSLEVEPEVVNSTAKVAKAETIPAAVPATPLQAPAPEPPKATPPAPAAPVVGLPSAEQMAEYRKKVGVFTAELPSSEGMGSVQKMRAFITHMSGNPPQDMTVAQWEETIAWFDAFVAKNTVKGLIKYVNDTLGVK
jgi:hypothetical protein